METGLEEELEELDKRLSIVEDALETLLTSKMSKVKHDCLSCGEIFYARRDALYCSAACKQSHYLKRKNWLNG